MRMDKVEGCDGKKIFDSFQMASRVAKRRRRAGAEMRDQHPYRCPVCQKWHIGSHDRTMERKPGGRGNPYMRPAPGANILMST